MLLAALLSLAAVPACTKSGDADSKGAKDDVKIASITIDDADKLLAAKQATAVDCNGAPTRKRMGTIPGAILVTDDEAFAASELPADKQSKLVFYCGGPG